MPCCGKKQERPMPTRAQGVSAVKAILFSKRVPPEVINARLDICNECEHRAVNAAGFQWCSLCGCLVNGSKGLTNLASYEEGDGVTMTHGCHHPQRAGGKGWPSPPRLQSPISNLPSSAASAPPSLDTAARGETL